jgi:leucyl/phenylalanyl-tRNA--protein transferase
MPVSLASQTSPQATTREAGAHRAGKRTAIMERRAALFHETAWETCQRVALGTVWSLLPKRIGKLWPLTRVWLTELVAPRGGLPDPEIPAGAGEFAGMVHDLAPATLIGAYRRGLFPLTHFGPLKWMSPSERCVLFFDEYHISRRLRDLLRQGKYTVTFDRDFEGVIKACAGRRAGRWHLTWITPRIMQAYAELYDAGYVHSFEVWDKDGHLVGGGYGVALGKVFVPESLFSREANTSKYGLSVLNWHLAKWGFLLSDGKWATPTILQMGFRMIPRAEYLRNLAVGLEREGKSGQWDVEAGPKIVADWNFEKSANAVTETNA